MKANIIIEVRLPDDMLDKDDPTGVSAETYDLIVEALGFTEEVSVYPA